MTAPSYPGAVRTHTMTADDLRRLLEDVPDWAVIKVIAYDEDCAEEHDPYITYAAGVLTIDVA